MVDRYMKIRYYRNITEIFLLTQTNYKMDEIIKKRKKKSTMRQP